MFRKSLASGVSARLVWVLVTAGMALSATAQVRDSLNFDARIDAWIYSTPGATQKRAVAAAQQAGVESLRRQIPDLAVSFDERTGVTRTLSNRVGYLSAVNSGTPLDVATGYVSAQVDLLGLTIADLQDFEVRTVHLNPATGASHVYLRQTALGLPLYNGQLQVNLNRNGRIVSVNNAFLRDLATSVNTTTPGLTAQQAVGLAAEQIGIAADPGAVSTAQLMLLAIQRGEARLVFNLQIETPDSQHYFDFNVDALTGEIWTRFDWVNSEASHAMDAALTSNKTKVNRPGARRTHRRRSRTPGRPLRAAVEEPVEPIAEEAIANLVAPEIKVYPIPVESPNHTTPLPPSDGRTLVVDPADPAASPLGWHDTGSTFYTIMRGNNVHAYDDIDNNNLPPAAEPDCGSSLHCDFPIVLGDGPLNYVPASVANLFYWNNVIHDIQYLYGFDEAAGNFQVNNFANGGLGNDDVRAEAQDGSGKCNANFLTLPDGSRPRMQMYTCNDTTPHRDGDLDNGIIVHEYGHGIAIRTIGGPANVSCMENNQEPGEGVSDLLGLMYTSKVGDTGADARGMGTYFVGEPPEGPGIRPAPYSTDFGVNDFTYSDIATQVIPHGVGFVWATAAWEAYWELVGIHGFDPDLYNAAGGSGNQRMMLYVQEGLANTACSPTFLDARDGIIQAATDNYGGEDVCPLWEAFARRGLGSDATTVGPNSRTATDGFDIPLACQCIPIAIADAGPDQAICSGESTSVGTPAQPVNSYLWSPGGQTTAEITISPTVDTTYTVTATTSECSNIDSATVFVTDGVSSIGLSEDFETGATGWTTSGLWHLADSEDCGLVAPTTPPTTMYYGLDTSCNYNTGSTTTGSLTSPVILGVNATSELSFKHSRKVESFSSPFDITFVEVINLGTGATTIVFSQDSRNGSSGEWLNSGTISLAAFDGIPIRIEFTFNSVDEEFNTFTGWFIDDVEVTGSFECVACAFDDDGDTVCNEVDNCLDVPNPNQIDTNQDGYGNLCDPDLTNDNAVGIPDFNIFRPAFGTACADSGYDADADLNSDCAIGIPDFNIFRTYFGAPPGPSGYACAGTVPCP